MFRRRLALLLLPLVAALAFAVSPASKATPVHATSNCGQTRTLSGWESPTNQGNNHYVTTQLTVNCSGGYMSYTELFDDALSTNIVTHIRVWVCGNYQGGYGSAYGAGKYTTPWFYYGSCGAQADDYYAYGWNNTEWYYISWYLSFP